MLSREIFTTQLKELIEFRSTAKNQKEIRECLEYIASTLPSSINHAIIREDISPILLAGRELSKTPDILFLAHADVVDGNDEQFKAKMRGDTLIGRGASDMKFSIPIGVALLHDHIASDLEHSYMIAVTTDEETGGFKGAKYLADEYGLKPKNLIVLDGGDNHTLIHSSKGILDLNIESTGRPTHPCRPYKGENPIHSIAIAGAELLDMFPNSEKAAGKESATVYLETIQGGNSTDRYSNQSTMEAVICYPDSMQAEELLAAIEARLHKKLGDKIGVRILATGEAVYTDRKAPSFVLLQRKMQEQFGKPIRTDVQAGGSDARHFNRTNATVLMTKPHGGGIHGDREHVSITSSLLLYQALHYFMREYTQAKGDL